MKHPERIEDYLEHIAEAIDRITAYIQEIDNAASLERDHKTQAAVIRYVEIIGRDHLRRCEQNSQTSAGVRYCPSFATVERNAGDALDIDVLWSTVKDDLPRLKQQIDALLKR